MFHELNLIERDPSYTIQTIKVLRQTLKELTELAWIIGADSLIEYKIWKDFDDVLKLSSLVVTTRPNYDLEQVPLEIRNQITIFRITGSDISATEIRDSN